MKFHDTYKVFSGYFEPNKKTFISFYYLSETLKHFWTFDNVMEPCKTFLNLRYLQAPFITFEAFSRAFRTFDNILKPFTAFQGL